VDPTGYKRNGRDKEPDDPLPDLPDWLLELLSDPEFWKLLDGWLWDNVPSAFGAYGSVSGSLGVVVEGEISAEISLMFNWRSGELTFLYGPGAGTYLGTPRGGSLSASAGGICAFGAFRNDRLEGVDIYYGGIAGVDAVATAGLEIVGSTGLSYEDVNGSGSLDMNDKPALFVDPESNRHVTSLQVGTNVGINGAPNGVEVGGVTGLSVTEGFNIIPGWDWGWWPWNWGK
jgi:hypothetical protein